MTAHLQGFDQRLFRENVDVLLAQSVWNVGRFAGTDVAWPSITLSLERSKVTACSAEQLVRT